jgi:hypothetical protein
VDERIDPLEPADALHPGREAQRRPDPAERIGQRYGEADEEGEMQPARQQRQEVEQRQQQE